MTQKYIKIEKIGEGACGTVYKAKDTETNQIVAIKKYKYLALNEGIPQNCLREIQVLRSLEFRKDVAGIKNVIMHESGHVYAIFDYYKCSLDKILASEQEIEWRSIIVKMVEAVQGIHILNIIHRDIKPPNILVNQQNEPLLADFGLAKQLQLGQKMTNFVGTPAFRAPQLIFGDIRYGKAIDIWSLGCTIYQIFAKKSLFQCTSQINLLSKMFSLFSPFQQIPLYFKNLPNFQSLKLKLNQFQSNQQYLQPNILSIIPIQYHQLMTKMLDVNPQTRISAQQALLLLKKNPHLVT